MATDLARRAVTADLLISRYADDIAFVAEETAATTAQEFIEQLGTAADRLGYFAGINGAEDLETAATYLSDAMEAKGAAREVLLKQAVGYLNNTAEMVDEYRDMV